MNGLVKVSSCLDSLVNVLNPLEGEKPTGKNQIIIEHLENVGRCIELLESRIFTAPERHPHALKRVVYEGHHISSFAITSERTYGALSELFKLLWTAPFEKHRKSMCLIVYEMLTQLYAFSFKDYAPTLGLLMNSSEDVRMAYANKSYAVLIQMQAKLGTLYDALNTLPDSPDE
jgi:hypothetical protein